MDLLSNLDATRSARVRSCDCRDRKISAAIVATADNLDDLALGACSLADCLQRISRTKICDPRRDRILPRTRYRSQERTRANRRRALRLCCRHDSLFHNRATLPTVTPSHRAAVSRFLSITKQAGLNQASIG